MEKYALINGIILDGTQDMQPLTGKAILISGSKIEAIVDGKQVPSHYKEIDLGGKYVMPGLINLHVHLAGSGKPKKKSMDPVKAVKLVTANNLTKAVGRRMVAGYARTQLCSGTTTIRTVGGILDFDAQARDAIAAGKIPGPRILASNMAISVPGGHMAGSLAHIVTTPGEASACVDRIAATKPDLIKLMITGGVLDAEKKGEPGVLKMSPEIVRAACNRAHALGLKVAAHVESPEGIRVALQNGVDTIEHGAKPDDEILALFKSTGASLVTTLSPSLSFALFDQSVSHATDLQKYNGKIVMDGIVECARQCLAAGIPVGLGTDTACPYVTQYDTWRELALMRRFCGVSNGFALHTATQVNARIAGIEQETGTVQAGKDADLIITVGNPLADLSALRNISAVVARGRFIAEPKVKKLPEVEQELDNFL